MKTNLELFLEAYVDGKELENPKASIKSLEDWSNLEKILKKIIKQNKGNFPSQKYLNKNGYSTVAAAISKYHKGFPAMRKNFGFQLVKKPNGYWDDEKNILSEARKVMKNSKLIKLPGHMQLNKLGHADLGSAIQKSGGYYYFREKLGQKDMQKKYGTWKNIDYVLEELERIMAENDLKVLPTQTILYDLGYSSLASAIAKYHGGFRNLRKKRGEKVIHAAREWEDFTYAREQAMKCMEENHLNSLPNIKNLKEMGYGALAKGIMTYHGGMRLFRDKLGQQQIATAAGTWNVEYTIKKAREAMKKLKTESLPCSEILRKRGYNTLASAISKNYGFRKFRELFGEEQKRTESDLLKNFDYIKDALYNLMQENNWDIIPSKEIICKHGGDSLVGAIYKYHGGIVAVRKKLGQQQLRKPLNYWKDPNNIQQEAIKILKELQTDTLPSSRFLTHQGYANFVVAVQNYHGGIPVLRKRLQESLGVENSLELFLTEYVEGEQ